MVEVGKGRIRGASNLKMDIKLAEEFEGRGRDGGTGNALVGLHGQVGQLIQPSLGRESEGRVGRGREVGDRRSGVGGVGDEVGGVGGGGVGSRDVVRHDASNDLDGMNHKQDHKIHVN